MSDKRLTNIEADIRLIKAAILGHEGNAEEGILSIARNTERRVAKLETERSTIWAAIVAIPVLAGAIAFFMPDIPAPRNNGSHQN